MGGKRQQLLGPDPGDLALDAALTDLRARCLRRRRGRVTCTVELVDGVCVGYRIEEDAMLERDIDRIMRERRAVEA